MQREAYLEMRQNEERNWWFVGRRAVIDRVLSAFSKPDAGRSVLEIGCGTGGNLAMLSRYGRLSAMELNEEACGLANQRGLCRVEQGYLPGKIPFPESFDLICMFDVLEHIEQDLESLQAVRQKLKPGGRLVLTVPAHPCLWSAHDTNLDHKRRYVREGLARLIREAGMTPLYVSHFNTFLFLPIAFAIMITNWFHRDGSQMKMSPLNGILARLFSAERHFLPARSFPFGVSLVAVCTVGKPSS